LDIEFKVGKSWIREHSIDELTVKLNRYVDGTWYPLPTEKVGENDANIYYSATSPGLSTFAITGELKKLINWVLISGLTAIPMLGGMLAYYLLRKYRERKMREKLF